MAKFVQKQGILTVNGVDLSSHASTVSFSQEKDRVDVTGQTTAGFREETDGFSTAEATITFFVDEATGKTHPTLNPLFASGSIFPITWKPLGAAGTVVWHMDQAKIYSWGSGGAGVGDAASVDVTFSNAGTAGISVGTA